MLYLLGITFFFFSHQRLFSFSMCFDAGAEELHFSSSFWGSQDPGFQTRQAGRRLCGLGKRNEFFAVSGLEGWLLLYGPWLDNDLVGGQVA